MNACPATCYFGEPDACVIYAQGDENTGSHSKFNGHSAARHPDTLNAATDPGLHVPEHPDR
jgi:hypothetical protein